MSRPPFLARSHRCGGRGHRAPTPRQRGRVLDSSGLQAPRSRESRGAAPWAVVLALARPGQAPLRRRRHRALAVARRAESVRSRAGAGWGSAPPRHCELRLASTSPRRPRRPRRATSARGRAGPSRAAPRRERSTASEHLLEQRPCPSPYQPPCGRIGPHAATRGAAAREARGARRTEPAGGGRGRATRRAHSPVKQAEDGITTAMGMARSRSSSGCSSCWTRTLLFGALAVTLTAATCVDPST